MNLNKFITINIEVFQFHFRKTFSKLQEAIKDIYSCLPNEARLLMKLIKG